MIIRPATWLDAYKITELWGEMNLEVYTRESMREEMANPRSFFYKLLVRLESTDWYVVVAEDNAGIVGFILSGLHWPAYSTCHLLALCEAIYVEPDYRNKGIHKLLMDESVKWGKEKGVKEVEFLSVSDPKMVRFYEQFDCEPVQVIYRKRL